MSHFLLRTNPYPRLPRGLLRRAVPGTIQDRFEWGIRVTDAERAEIRRVYEPHVAQLAQLLGRSLPWPAPGGA